MIRKDVSFTHCPVCDSKLFRLHSAPLWAKCPSTSHDYDVFTAKGDDHGYESLYMHHHMIRNAKGLSVLSVKKLGDHQYKELYKAINNCIPMFRTKEELQNFLICI